jgi:glycosyltransferase involved in cell wall biosynthesis
VMDSSQGARELAAVVLTRNEERHIADCLDSLAWVDQRVILDDFSMDRTAEIARARGACVLQRALDNFAAQRDAALELVQTDWVLFVDADERATPALAQEVRHVIRYEGDLARAGWWVPRHNHMIGHRMRGGGWFPDYQLRLLRRGKVRYDPARPVHEIVLLDGEAGYLNHVLVHYNYDTLAQFRHKQGVRARPWTYASMPAREFWRRFVTLQGYRDHAYGLLFCGLMAWYTLSTYWRLRELRSGSDQFEDVSKSPRDIV